MTSRAGAPVVGQYVEIRRAWRRPLRPVHFGLVVARRRGVRDNGWWVTIEEADGSRHELYCRDPRRKT